MSPGESVCVCVSACVCLFARAGDCAKTLAAVADGACQVCGFMFHVV